MRTVIGLWLVAMLGMTVYGVWAGDWLNAGAWAMQSVVLAVCLWATKVSRVSLYPCLICGEDRIADHEFCDDCQDEMDALDTMHKNGHDSWVELGVGIRDLAYLCRLNPYAATQLGLTQEALDSLLRGDTLVSGIQLEHYLAIAYDWGPGYDDVPF